MLVNICFSACKPESFSTGTDWTFGFQACMYTYTIICNMCLHFEYLHVYMWIHVLHVIMSICACKRLVDDTSTFRIFSNMLHGQCLYMYKHTCSPEPTFCQLQCFVTFSGP